MLISWNEAEDHQDPKRQNEHSTYSVLDSLLLLCISSRTCHHRVHQFGSVLFSPSSLHSPRYHLYGRSPHIYWFPDSFPSDSSSCTCRFGEGAVETSYLVE